MQFTLRRETDLFGRLFELEFLRVGVDIINLKRLIGHSDLQVLRRYLKQTDQDTYFSHRRAGPVDNSWL
jgi:hypothetical protein